MRHPVTPCAFQQLQPAAALCTLEAQTPLVVSLHFSSSVTIRIRWLISLETCSPLKEMGPSFLLRNVYYPQITRSLQYYFIKAWNLGDNYSNHSKPLSDAATSVDNTTLEILFIVLILDDRRWEVNPFLTLWLFWTNHKMAYHFYYSLTKQIIFNTLLIFSHQEKKNNIGWRSNSTFMSMWRDITIVS